MCISHMDPALDLLAHVDIRLVPGKVIKRTAREIWHNDCVAVWNLRV